MNAPISLLEEQFNSPLKGELKDDDLFLYTPDASREQTFSKELSKSDGPLRLLSTHSFRSDARRISSGPGSTHPRSVVPQPLSMRSIKRRPVSSSQRIFPFFMNS